MTLTEQALNEIDSLCEALDKEVTERLERQEDANAYLIEEARAAVKRKRTYGHVAPVYYTCLKLLDYYEWYNKRRKWLPARVKRRLAGWIVPVKDWLGNPFEELLIFQRLPQHEPRKYTRKNGKKAQGKIKQSSQGK